MGLEQSKSLSANLLIYFNKPFNITQTETKKKQINSK